MTSCPAPQCTVDPGADPPWWALFVDPPGWAVWGAVLVMMLGTIVVGWRVRQRGLGLEVKVKVVRNWATVFAAVVLTGGATIWLPFYAAAAVGGLGSWLVGREVATVAADTLS